MPWGHPCSGVPVTAGRLQGELGGNLSLLRSCPCLSVFLKGLQYSMGLTPACYICLFSGTNLGCLWSISAWPIPWFSGFCTLSWTLGRPRHTGQPGYVFGVFAGLTLALSLAIGLVFLVQGAKSFFGSWRVGELLNWVDQQRVRPRPVHVL